jgi:hypothetical protein
MINGLAIQKAPSATSSQEVKLLIGPMPTKSDQNTCLTELPITDRINVVSVVIRLKTFLVMIRS